MTYSDWLAALGVGDEVGVHRMAWRSHESEVRRVVRATAKQLILNGYGGREGLRMWREHGHEVGDYNGSYIVPVTDEFRAKAELLQLRGRVGDLFRGGVSDAWGADALRGVVAAIEAADSDKEALP